MSLLEERVAVIAGLGPGLGRASALRLAEHGAAVVLGARSQSGLDAVAAEVRAIGGRVAHAVTDLTRPEDCRGLAALAVDEFGRLDILVHNATRRAEPGSAIVEANVEDWRRSMDVNLWGAVNMVQAVMPSMRSAGDGRIIVIGAMTTRVVSARGRGDYALSKAALGQLVRNLAFEVGADGIRVNAVVPGWIDGPTVERLRDEGGVEGAAAVQRAIDSMPLGAMPTPYEIAGAVVFFASDLSLPITGQSLDVNAGQYMHA